MATPAAPAPQSLLVVDGDDGNRHVLDAVLRSAGYHVRATRTGLLALYLAAVHPPSLLITDFRLPDMTAAELVERLPSKGSRVPVLLVTGDISPEARQAGLQADGYVLKPYDIDAVLGKVALLLDPVSASC